MLQPFDSGLIQSMSGTVIPLAILMLETDEEREFMSELYIEYKQLIAMTAYGFFPHNPTAASEAVSDVIASLCKRCKNLMIKERNDLPGYIVNTTRNTCKTALRRSKTERANRDYYADEYIEKYADNMAAPTSVFDMADSGSIIQCYYQLSDSDQMLISMKYIEKLKYSEMAEKLCAKENTLKTKVYRAKRNLEKLMAEGNCDSNETKK